MDNQTGNKNEMCDNQMPLVTFALFAYNQEKYIKEAIEGAFSQTYPKLEITISDDCSTDSTFEIIESLASDYSGPHTIVINRNPTNLGIAQHFNQIVTRARGEIIVIAAGDDISMPTRALKSVEILNSAPEATMVSFTDIRIDSNGTELPCPPSSTLAAITKVTLNQYIKGRGASVSGASRAYRKKIFDVFGNLNASCPTEDTPSLLRGLMLGHALISSQPEIRYRLHDSSASAPRSLHSMRFDEIRNQYACDASLALRESLISNDTFNFIGDWIDTNYQRRLLTAELFRSRRKLVFFFSRLLHSKHFAIREKGRLFRDIIFGG